MNIDKQHISVLPINYGKRIIISYWEIQTLIQTNKAIATKILFDGDRLKVREQACMLAMQGLIDLLQKELE